MYIQIGQEKNQLFILGRCAMVAKKNKLLLFVLAILLPPLAVYLVKGIKKDFWINIILCIFFWIPGIIHAMYVVL